MSNVIEAPKDRPLAIKVTLIVLAVLAAVAVFGVVLPKATLTQLDGSANGEGMDHQEVMQQLVQEPMGVLILGFSTSTEACSGGDAEYHVTARTWWFLPIDSAYSDCGGGSITFE